MYFSLFGLFSVNTLLASFILQNGIVHMCPKWDAPTVFCGCCTDETEQILYCLYVEYIWLETFPPCDVYNKILSSASLQVTLDQTFCIFSKRNCETSASDVLLWKQLLSAAGQAGFFGGFFTLSVRECLWCEVFTHNMTYSYLQSDIWTCPKHVCMVMRM